MFSQLAKKLGEKTALDRNKTIEKINNNIADLGLASICSTEYYNTKRAFATIDPELQNALGDNLLAVVQIENGYLENNFNPAKKLVITQEFVTSRGSTFTDETFDLERTYVRLACKYIDDTPLRCFAFMSIRNNHRYKNRRDADYGEGNNGFPNNGVGDDNLLYHINSFTDNRERNIIKLYCWSGRIAKFTTDFSCTLILLKHT